MPDHPVPTAVRLITRFATVDDADLVLRDGSVDRVLPLVREGLATVTLERVA